MLQKQKNTHVIDKKIAKDIKVAIVRTSYYIELNDNLEKHALETLIKNGVARDNIQTFTAPGSWEIPLIVKALAETKKYDAIIAFGVIVKGETYHFDMIANECARSLMQISTQYTLPVGFEILAVYDKKHAVERASDDEFNKGKEAATAVLHALNTLSIIHS